MESKKTKICLLILTNIIILILSIGIIVSTYPILNPYIKKILTINSFKYNEKVMETIVREWNNFDYKYMYMNKEYCRCGVIFIESNMQDERYEKKAYAAMLAMII